MVVLNTHRSRGMAEIHAASRLLCCSPAPDSDRTRPSDPHTYLWRASLTGWCVRAACLPLVCVMGAGSGGAGLVWTSYTPR